jgi:hypothetical protein
LVLVAFLGGFSLLFLEEMNQPLYEFPLAADHVEAALVLVLF